LPHSQPGERRFQDRVAVLAEDGVESGLGPQDTVIGNDAAAAGGIAVDLDAAVGARD
jgi:hypothetical protein